MGAGTDAGGGNAAQYNNNSGFFETLKEGEGGKPWGPYVAYVKNSNKA